MFEEDISEVTLDQPESGQHDDTVAAEQDKPTELPDDKDALKQTALELQEKLKEQSKESARHKREAERQRQSAEEQKTKADYWSREAQRKQAEGTDKAPDKQPTKQSSAVDVKTALKGLDLTEYVAMEEGGLEKLVGDLEKAGVIVTPNRLEEILDKRLDERVSRERTQTQAESRAYREVVSRYPDLEDPESELAVEAAAEFEKLEETHKHLDGATRFELAASRAATAIGYKAQPKTKQPAQISTQGRLRGAQKSTTTGGNARQPVPVVVKDDVKKAARMMGFSEKDAAEHARGVQIRQQKAR